MTDQAATPDSAQVAPIGGADRIDSLDFIRGLAVMGILAANIIAFGQPFTAYLYPSAFLVPANDPNGWLWITQFVLIDGKMRGLFTLLFGAGLYLFMERAWARGETRRRQALRLMFLLMFGIIHFFFIWPGDILMFYAVGGLIALPMLKWQSGTQLKVGIIGYISGVILYALMMAFPALITETALGQQPEFSETLIQMQAGKVEALNETEPVTALIQAGDYTGLVAYRLAEQWSDPLIGFLFFWLETVPLILIGMALYRKGFFSGGMDHAKMRMWGWIGIIVGGTLHLLIGLWVQSTGFSYYATIAALMGISMLPRIMMVLGLASLLVLSAPSAMGWIGQRIKAAGRAAFTNYLGTSIVMMFVFHGWALGLYGELNRPQLYLVVLIMWIVMLAWSKPWLERYRYGPLEWLWRCLTYRKLFALKR